MPEEVLVQRTYQALLGVVQTTAVSKKVLARPPFTFLHKLLVETLGDFDLFTNEQLHFATITTKQDKAAFLTRALAFVTAMMHAHSDHAHVSCLLLVSPIRVLAGVAVEDTLEFLLQLCEVCRMPDREAKDAAAQEVLHKGDAQLYSSGVTFRKGLVLIQAVIRTFLKRRVGKRRALETAPQLTRTFSSEKKLSMAVGTKFLKEIADGHIYNGVIRNVQKHTYILGYEEDSEAEDRVDEIEMRIILEESQRFIAQREGGGDKATSSGSQHLSRNPSNTRVDGDISLTGLPDLSPSEITLSRRPKLFKRMSSRDSGLEVLTPKVVNPATLIRSQSQRFDSSRVTPFTSQMSGTSAVKKDANALSSSIKQAGVGSWRNGSLSTGEVVGNQEEAPEQRRQSSNASDWQGSLKRLLAEGREQPQSLATTPETNGQGASQPEAAPKWKQKASHPLVASTPPTPDNVIAHISSFPKLKIPGTKQLAPVVSKRVFNGPPHAGDSNSMGKPSQNTGPPAQSSMQSVSAPAVVVRGSSFQRSVSSVSIPRVSLSVVPTSGVGGSEGLVDTAFAGTYQTKDQHAQEKLALIRDIVLRIDGYMKRKRLRVIDLFRFCDADGNGSISPQEMIDTLSQMEIQLTPDQAREFLNHIDKDGNGSIDIDEFEEIVRVARRSEAQREQLKKELNNPRKQSVENKPSGKYNAVVKAKQRILDEFKAAQDEDGAGVSAAQLRSIIARLGLPGVDNTLINHLVDRAAAVPTGNLGSSAAKPDFSTVLSPSPSPTTPQLASLPSARSPNGKNMIYSHQLATTLDELEWTKKSNRFLDQSWISQFDSQLERAIREYELL
ncbi:hypothetical protein BBJ28_00001687 [Nothophytophthora sp. Chile5]|nr:hypothetical protein BBJ28_00001687 [Nothophytophthora sp. Chile5]